MKTKTLVTDITHDDLVELFNAALYGSQCFGADYDSNEYRKIPNPNEYDCFEDRLAKMLLNGKSITVSDFYAEDEEDFYGKLPHTWDDENGTMDYTITLKDIERGFVKCLDGTFKVNDGYDDEVAYMKRCMNDLINHEDGNFDYPEAANVLQIILFGQMVYA